MKRSIITVALFGVLATMAVSCQKEDIADMAPVSPVSKASTVYTVQYVVDDMPHSTTIHNKSEEQVLMEYLMTRAREGEKINIQNNDARSQHVTTKATKVYITTSEANASSWLLQKIHEGYNVTIVYNSDNGEYTCIAVR